MLAEIEGAWKQLAEFAGVFAAALLLALLPWLKVLAARVMQNSAMGKTLWRAQIDRGKLEANEKDLAKFEKPTGPLQLTEAVREKFAPIAAALRRMGEEAKQATVMDSDILAFRIERRFREWMLENVCLPLKVHKMACLALAVAIATEGQDERGQAGEVAG